MKKTNKPNKSLSLNTEKLSSELSKESNYNWIIKEGVSQFESKKLSTNMSTFLVIMGILE